MAQQSFDAVSSGQRRRKLTIALALIMASVVLAIGGSLYQKQKTAKTEAQSAASQEKPAEGKSASTGVVAATETPSTPEVAADTIAAVETTDGGAVKAEDGLAQKLAQKQQKKPKVASKKTDEIAEKLLTEKPSAAGMPTDAAAPGSLAAAVEPAIVAAPAKQEAPTLAEALLEANPTGAGAGAAPAPNNVTSPTGSAGQTPGGTTTPTPTTPVPEPSTWLMMLGGLGLLAASARRRT